MSERETTLEKEEPGVSVLPVKYVAAIVVLVSLAMLPFIFFLIHAEGEVSEFSTLLFKSRAEKAIESGSFDRAIRICTGALRVGISRSDYWGTAYFVRAKAHAGKKDFGKALDDIETAARLWSRAPYNASEQDRDEISAFGVEFCKEFVDGGDIAGALRAISAAAMGSCNPVDFLHRQSAGLPEQYRNALWPDGPFIVVEGYGGEQPPEFSSLTENSGRKLIASRIDSSGGREGRRCAVLELAAGSGGESICNFPVSIPLSDKPFAFRVAVKPEPECAAKLFVGYWFDYARKSDATNDGTVRDLGDGWRLIELKRDFFTERTAAAKKGGYDASGGVINRIGLSLPPGDALRCIVDRVELSIPQAGQ